jgi:hypothetical protein
VLPVLKYTVLRLTLFVAALCGLLGIGASPLTSLVLGVLISAALSYLLLRRQRAEMTAALAERLERRRTTPRAPGRDEAAEDEKAEDASAGQSQPEPEQR